MKSHIKRTKIIATLGPAVTGYIFTNKDFEDKKNKPAIDKAKENIEKLIDAGVNVFRFNFSHGDHEEQSIRINLIREVEAKTGKSVSLMLDTKGPEIRIGKFKDKTAEIKTGTTVTLVSNNLIEGNASKFSIYSSAPGYYVERDLKVGDLVYVDDGKLQLTVKSIDETKHEIVCEALNTHVLIANKRVNLPNAEYSMPFISEKDENDIKFAVENNFDYIACSFVNTTDNVAEVRSLINKYGKDSPIQIVSKIETQQAINNIDDIISVSDAVMVARGDLGLEIPYYEVPYWEKYMIKACRYQGKPVIVATQMLDSLEKNKQPTRAEVTDVFYAVERGADATMLSGESANGIDPINAVTVMATIDKKAEEFFDYNRAHDVYFKQTFFSKKPFGKTVEKIAKQVEPRRTIGNSEFPYDAIIYFGSDIEKIKGLSNVRPAANIFVVTDKKRLQKFFGLNYGVTVLVVENLINTLSSYKDKVNQIHDDFELQRASIVLIDDQYKKTEF